MTRYNAAVTRIPLLLTAVALLAPDFAGAFRSADRQFQSATVLSSKPLEVERPGHRWKRTDARPPVTEFDYAVTLRLNCEIYVGRYQSAIDYLPANLSADQSVQVSADKHLLYVKVPGQNDVMMTIVDKRAAENCNSSGR